ncbi:hypothetical protein LCGC14_2129640 [marine sediment metagenome]|uniref:Uncharacterized protein n=1 Tax=marine sediment metagenome TaxID=412755 RepID=A0A0F9E1U8_9ZZZZ
MRVFRIRWLIDMGLIETAQFSIESQWDQLTYNVHI